MATPNWALERTFDPATVLLPQAGVRVKCRSTKTLCITAAVWENARDEIILEAVNILVPGAFLFEKFCGAESIKVDASGVENMGRYSLWHFIIILALCGYLASIVHIAVSIRTRGFKKGAFVVAGLLVPFVPYLVWLIARDSASTADSLVRVKEAEARALQAEAEAREAEARVRISKASAPPPIDA